MTRTGLHLDTLFGFAERRSTSIILECWLKTSCAVSGTGYLVNSDIIKKYKGWKCNLLTEDIQFSVINILDGEKIGYCSSAMFYDEQPETFKQSWNQRMRWSKRILSGNVQIWKRLNNDGI